MKLNTKRVIAFLVAITMMGSFIATPTLSPSRYNVVLKVAIILAVLAWTSFAVAGVVSSLRSGTYTHVNRYGRVGKTILRAEQPFYFWICMSLGILFVLVVTFAMAAVLLVKYSQIS
jgi:hypothetical protein